MKTIFIINPMAGKGNSIEKLKDKILDTANKINADADVYITKAVGDAELYVKDYCAAYGPARFIACGGDGTFSEVLNGAISTRGAEVGVVPMGTGNDFCRNFNSDTDFFSIEAQIKGDTYKCDAIRYNTVLDGQSKVGYCANMFNIGFDCNVADMTARMKKYPFVSGSLAYLLSIFAILIKKKGAKLLIELDGKQIHKGKLLLTSISNGRYCGGGVMSNPLASVNDGFIDINIIRNISRTNFLTKLPFYLKGTHIKLKGIENVILNKKCKKVAITPIDNKIRLCIDGEITDAARCDFEIIHNAFNFVVPDIKNLKNLKKPIEIIGII